MHHPLRIPSCIALVALLGTLASLGLTACNNPDPTVDRDPTLDEELIGRYEQSKSPNGATQNSGIIATRSGLKYEVIEQGTGDTPGYRDTVTVHYRGTNQQGQVFDESYSRGRPARIRLDEVVDGWAEGLQLMQEGATYRLIIPPYLAYGSRGRPPMIGPNETLTFEVQLIEVN